MTPTGAVSRSAAWTTFADVKRKVRRRWDTGTLLRMAGEDAEWEPLAFVLRGPSARDIVADIGSSREWISAWNAMDGRHLRIERKTVGGRIGGVNRVPAKAWIDGYDQAWALLGVTGEVAAYLRLLRHTRVAAPALVAWMLTKPLRVLELQDDWTALVRTALWIDQQASSDMYVREIDVPGVDTKFIERHRLVLCDLLDLQLPETRINPDISRSDFAARYGFRTPPRFVRMRSLDLTRPLAGGFTELHIRSDELAAAPPTAATVYVIENAVTYLAFPPDDDAVAILGAGYGVAVLDELGWLADRRLIYWGDIDTHGFVMLNRLRRRFGNVASILMDRATLLDHEPHWSHEAEPAVEHLEQLTPQESALYHELVEGTFGAGVRLEQERVSYAAVQRVVR